MWLLDVHTKNLVQFMDDRATKQKYAILSHTWEEDEVAFSDIHLPHAKHMRGFKKIDYLCLEAQYDGLDYAWIDTCCINKESSSELTEAINSMWRWYASAAVCYAYLSDVTLSGAVVRHSERPPSEAEALRSLFHSSRWFTRGWTLQELVAPRAVVFFDSVWWRLGLLDKTAGRNPTKLSSLSRRRGDPLPAHLLNAICSITGISDAVLSGSVSLATCSTAEKLSWASKRQTTRLEDQAYSLLGLLNVNMPLLYGEGARAFLRLQEEVLASTLDPSVLAWTPYLPEQCRLLQAPDPYCFRHCAKLINETEPSYDFEYAMTNRGLRATLPIKPAAQAPFVLARLKCRAIGTETGFVTLRLQPVGPSPEPKMYIRGPKVYEVVRSMDPQDQESWSLAFEPDALWTDLILLQQSANINILVDLGPGLSVVNAGVGEIGHCWHWSRSEFSIPPNVQEPAFIEIRDDISGRRKLLSLLRWRLQDLVVGWTDCKVYLGKRPSGQSLGMIVLNHARNESVQTWHVPGSTTVIDVEVSTSNLDSYLHDRAFPQNTALLRITRHERDTNPDVLWSSLSPQIRLALALRLGSRLQLTSDMTGDLPGGDLVRAALLDNGGWLRRIYSSDLARFVSETRTVELMIKHSQGEIARAEDDMGVDTLD